MTVLFLIFAAASLWLALKAKPLGNQPYRWGTFATIALVWRVFGLIVSSWNETVAGRPGGALVWSLVAGAYVAASIGLLQRRRFGVVALATAAVANLMLAPFFVSAPKTDILRLASRPVPVLSIAAFGPLIHTLSSDVWFLCTFVYFWKRWSLMASSPKRVEILIP